MREETLYFAFGTCQMTLNMPLALEQMNISKLQKFFKYVSQDYDRNERSMKEFFTFIPEIRQRLKNDWDEASKIFQRDYKSADPAAGNMRKQEIREINQKNRRLLGNVRKAKRDYESFLKKADRLEEIKKRYCE